MEIHQLHPLLIYKEPAVCKTAESSKLSLETTQHLRTVLAWWKWPHFGSHHQCPSGPISDGQRRGKWYFRDHWGANILAQHDVSSSKLIFYRSEKRRTLFVDHGPWLPMDFHISCEFAGQPILKPRDLGIPFLVTSNWASSQGTLLLGKARPELWRLRGPPFGTGLNEQQESTLWETNIAMENGWFLLGVPISHGDFL